MGYPSRMGSHCAVLLLERHWINFRFSIAGYVLGLCHAVSSPLSKSCHFECVHQLGCNFSTTCSPYTRILLLFGFTVALLTVKYISLTFALSLVLLTNTSLAYLLLPELHFFFSDIYIPALSSCFAYFALWNFMYTYWLQVCSLNFFCVLLLLK